MELRARTWDDYRGLIERYLESPPKATHRLGSVRMDKLTTAQVQALYSHMWNELKLSPETIQHLHTVLRQALTYAVEQGELARNPTDRVKVPKREQEVHDRGQGGVKHRAMSEEQAKRFLEAARADRYYPLWAVLLTGGLRPGEALGLQWADVDFEQGRVHVQRALTRIGLPKGEPWRLVPPKTHKARRVVPLSPLWP